MYTLASLHALKRHLGIATTTTADDDRLLAALDAATARIERLADRRFLPRIDTLLHSIDTRHPEQLLLEDDLLSFTDLTLDDGTVIGREDAVRLPGDGQPATLLQFINGASLSYTVSPYESAAVRGIWGWHDRAERMWRDSGDALAHIGVLDGDIVVLDVGDADGPDADGVSPRFQVGQLLKIGDEYLWLIAVDAQSDKLTVQRGVLGSVTAPYTPGLQIAIYQPPEDVEALALRWAAWLYKSADQADAGPVPTGLLAALAPLRRPRVG